MRFLIAAAVLLALSATGFAQEAKTTIKKVRIEPTNPASGAEMFKTYCAVCHGTEGKGNGPAASALKKNPADLTQLSKKNGGNYPELSVLSTIKGDTAGTGGAHGSRDMPVWGNLFIDLSHDQASVTLRIKNLGDYIHGIQAQ